MKCPDPNRRQKCLIYFKASINIQSQTQFPSNIYLIKIKRCEKACGKVWNMLKVNNKRYQNDANGVVQLSLLLALKIFHACFYFPIADFEQANVSWGIVLYQLLNKWF